MVATGGNRSEVTEREGLETRIEESAFDIASGAELIVSDVDDPRGRVKCRHGAAGGLVDVNARWLRLVVFIIGAGAVQPSVPENDSVGREHEPFEFADGRTGVAR